MPGLVALSRDLEDLLVKQEMCETDQLIHAVDNGSITVVSELNDSFLMDSFSTLISPPVDKSVVHTYVSRALCYIYQLHQDERWKEKDVKAPLTIGSTSKVQSKLFEK